MGWGGPLRGGAVRIKPQTLRGCVSSCIFCHGCIEIADTVSGVSNYDAAMAVGAAVGFR